MKLNLEGAKKRKSPQKRVNVSVSVLPGMGRQTGISQINLQKKSKREIPLALFCNNLAANRLNSLDFAPSSGSH